MTTTDPYNEDELLDYNPVTGEAVGERIETRAQRIANIVLDAVTTWDQNRPRSKQSSARILGPSEVGGCREYIRATVAGDEMKPPRRANLPAIWGTAIGDVIEEAMRAKFPEAVRTQFDVNTTLDVAGLQINVAGHGDVLLSRKALIDLKTKDGLAEAERKGGSFKELVQVSIYLLGLIASGELDDDAEAFLVFVDRSGRERRMVGAGVTADQARALVVAAQERLVDVQKALASGVKQSYLRDEPESWCYNVGCRFYDACWNTEEYRPSAKITNGRLVDAVDMYIEGRALKKQGETLMENAKTELAPDLTDVDRLPAGITPNGHSLKWTIVDRRGTIYGQIDVREG